MLNKFIFIPIFFSALIATSTSSAYANCKNEVDAFKKAQDARNKACNAASKKLKNKSLKEIKQGDSICKQKVKQLAAAEKKMRKCSSK